MLLEEAEQLESAITYMTVYGDEQDKDQVQILLKNVAVLHSKAKQLVIVLN